MYIPKPAGSPGCWSNKYQDGDRECEQCRFNDTCRPAMLQKVVSPPHSLPVVASRNYTPPYPPPAPVFMTPPAQTMVQLPAKPYIPPPPAPVMVKQPQITATQVTQQANQHYQQSTGYSLHNQQNPNPFVPLHRPGAPAPAYYITQYPGESVGSRIAKNAVLRAMEAIMYELMQFFRHWTWPPSGGR